MFTSNTSGMTAPPSGLPGGIYAAVSNVTLTTDHHQHHHQDDNNNTTTAAQQFVWLAEAVIQPTMLAFGILTNGLSLVTLPKVKMNNIFRICLTALALSDLFTCLTGFTSMLMEVLIFGGEMPFGIWDGRAVLTYVFFYLYMMYICTSASTVILIAVIRNAFILSPMKARRYFTPRNTKFACFLAFLLTFLVFTPTSLNIVYQSCFNDTDTEVCVDAFRAIPDLKQISSRYLFSVSTLFGPLMIVVYTICFISIRVTVGRSVEALTSMTSKSADGRRDSTRKRSKAASHVTRTLLVILILDVICTLPSVIQAVGLILAPNATVFDKTNLSYDVFDVIAEIFLNFRPTYNFWLYVFRHPEFRVRMRIMCCGFLPGRRRTTSGYERSMSSSEYKTENTYISRDTGQSNGRNSIALVRTGR